MTIEINPCLGCGAYDIDMGCTMPSIDMWFACPIESEKEENQKLLEEYIALASRKENNND